MIKGYGKEADLLNSFERCQSMKIGFNIYPVRLQSGDTECKESASLGKSLNYGQYQQGSLAYPLNKNVFDTSYI